MAGVRRGFGAFRPLMRQLCAADAVSVSGSPRVFLALAAGDAASLHPSGLATSDGFAVPWSKSADNAGVEKLRESGLLAFSHQIHHPALLNWSGWRGISSTTGTKLLENAMYRQRLMKNEQLYVSTASYSSTASEGRQDEDEKQVWSFDELANIPLPALALGSAGLIPFIALAPPMETFLPTALFHGTHAEAQAAYGAVILTFVGAPHWGLAMANYAVPSDAKIKSAATANYLRYLWSVVPSLLGWLALLLPSIPKFALLISSFGIALAVDVAFARMLLVPSWYLTLRLPLTTMAIVSLGSTLVVSVAASFR